MKKYNVAIVGGGFSGLCTAVLLKKQGVSGVVVIDANKRIGKKILATGNGQGNITNKEITPEHYHGDACFAAKVLKRYGRDELLSFFSEIGLIATEREGRFYPASLCASSVADVLRFALENSGTDVITDDRIIKVAREKGCFSLTTDSGLTVCAAKVVLAFGGSSGDGFSTDGKSYGLATAFGHTLSELSPSLVQLKTEREKIRGLKGIKQQASVTLFDGERAVHTSFGDLLFTDYGVSGNSIFYLSAYLRGLRKPHITVSFLPDLTEGELKGLLINKLGLLGKITCEKLLVSLLPSRLSECVIRATKRELSSLADYSFINDVVEQIKGYRLIIEGTAGFKASQVTAGGIRCAEVDPYTMQSKRERGLYIIGEALDVDGDCGGYNLQWAFSSAAVCAEALSKG